MTEANYVSRHVNRRVFPHGYAIVLEDDLDCQAALLGSLARVMDPQGAILVLAAPSSSFALVCIEAMKQEPIFALLDHDMPWGNGIDFLERRREKGWTFPVLAISGIPQNNEWLMEAGATAAISKHDAEGLAGFIRGAVPVTESKLVVIDAMVNKAVLSAAHGSDDGPVSTEQALAEIEAVLVAPAKVAKSLINPSDLKAPKVTDARSPATMHRAALAILDSSTERDPEKAMITALSRAGVPRETLPQMLESPDWAGTMARICQQYLVVTHLPKIVAAQVKKASLGDTAATKLLLDMFGKSDLDHLDEQTRALAEADPSTRLRHVKSLVEDLNRMVLEQERAGATDELVKEARKQAIASATERKKGSSR